MFKMFIVVGLVVDKLILILFVMDGEFMIVG